MFAVRAIFVVMYAHETETEEMPMVDQISRYVLIVIDNLIFCLVLKIYLQYNGRNGM